MLHKMHGMETLNLLIGIIACLVVGALIIYIVFTLRHKKEIVKMKDEFYALQIEKQAVDQKLEYTETELCKTRTSLEESEKEKALLRDGANLASADLKVARGNIELLEKNIADMKAGREKELEDARKDYEAKVETLKLMFKEEASKILEKSSKDLCSTNSEQMKNIIDPLSKDMAAFKKAVDDSKDSATKNTVTIEQQIKSMMEHTEKISKDANNLTEALRTKNKVVGNWGETILENALDNIGLVKGSDYELQMTIRDENGDAVKGEESGKRMIPDAVVFLPDNKAIVIDSKVSLKSFIDYTAEENPDQKEIYLKEFIQSVQAHIDELSAKKYGEYMKKSGKDALKYVIMFIPSENAFQLFFQNYLDKWHSAFDKGVIITGEANLFAMLKIVQVVWSQYKQQKEIDNIAKLSVELLNRVGRFVRNFSDVGKSLDSAQGKFDDAMKALNGRQSIRTTSGKLSKMGVEVPDILLSSEDISVDDNIREIEAVVEDKKDM